MITDIMPYYEVLSGKWFVALGLLFAIIITMIIYALPKRKGGER